MRCRLSHLPLKLVFLKKCLFPAKCFRSVPVGDSKYWDRCREGSLSRSAWRPAALFLDVLSKVLAALSIWSRRRSHSSLAALVGSGKDIGKDKPAFGWELEPFAALGSISDNVPWGKY